MTDRIQALTVVLDCDIRTDDVQRVVEAIEMVRGVASVSEQHVANLEDYMARERVRQQLGKTIFDVYRAICDGREIKIEPPST